jgi:hypothetical protein
MSLATPNGGAPTATTTKTTREAIVTALGGLASLTAYPVMPDVATAGAAWPRWVQTTYDGALCRLAKDTYEVFVTLPADYAATTVDQGDTYRDVVAMALVPIGRVQYAEPVLIQFADRQAMPGLRLRLTVN